MSQLRRPLPELLDHCSVPWSIICTGHFFSSNWYYGLFSVWAFYQARILPPRTVYPISATESDSQQIMLSPYSLSLSVQDWVSLSLSLSLSLKQQVSDHNPWTTMAMAKDCCKFTWTRSNKQALDPLLIFRKQITTHLGQNLANKLLKKSCLDHVKKHCLQVPISQTFGNTFV
jgi:hypothetical protein